jgi:copper homeostasis protein CutC
MIRKDYIEQVGATNPEFAIYKVLEQNFEYCLTKEEIYERLPHLGDERVLTIGQLNTALRNMTRYSKDVQVDYVRNRPYYSLRKN